LSKKRNFLNSKSFALCIATRFQKIDNTFILERNRRSLDFSIFISSIFLILFVQEIFFDFRNNSIFLLAIFNNDSISSITQISTKFILSKYYIVNDLEKKRRETSEILTRTKERKNILLIQVKILLTVTSIIVENNNLVNNLAMQKLINQTITRVLTSYNIQLSKLLSSIDFSSLASFAS